MTYEENHEEWLQQFSIEKTVGNLFLVRNHITNTFTIATNFCLKNCSYSGRIFDTVESLEIALKVFESATNEMSANKKVGVLC